MNTILLGNLIKIRWIAISGQLLAIFIVFLVFNIKIPFFESLIVVFLSVVINFYSYYLEKKINLYLTHKLFFFYFLI